jgi:hypothetical protein
MLNLLHTRMGRILHLKMRRNFPPTLKKQSVKYFLFSRRDIHGHKVHSKVTLGRIALSALHPLEHVLVFWSWVLCSLF